MRGAHHLLQWPSDRVGSGGLWYELVADRKFQGPRKLGSLSAAGFSANTRYQFGGRNSDDGHEPILSCGVGVIGMREDQHKFLMVHGQLPARLTVEQVRWLLNCQLDDVRILVSARLLKPLGNPPPNGIKFFATVEINELSKDKAWLIRATQAVNLHWRNQNLRKKSRGATEARRSPASLTELSLVAGA